MIKDPYSLSVELAVKAKGICTPNPAVGAVIVKKSEIIGTGCTSRVGGNHAEINAINSVKNKSSIILLRLFTAALLVIDQ